MLKHDFIRIREPLCAALQRLRVRLNILEIERTLAHQLHQSPLQRSVASSTNLQAISKIEELDEVVVIAVQNMDVCAQFVDSALDHLALRKEALEP